MNHRVLMVEDDENLGASVVRYLSQEGFTVDWVKSLSTAKDVLSTPSIIYHAILLDWALPDGAGIDLFFFLRQQKNSVPVIMLTARAELIDKVLGLESGACDYLTKPFEPRELLARLRVQVRQKYWSNVAGDAGSFQDHNIQVGKLLIKIAERELVFDGKLIEMTKMEYDLLRLLAESPNRVFSRDELLNKVWGYEHFPTTRTVDTHVLQIRQKCCDELIETVRGIGYRLKKV